MIRFHYAHALYATFTMTDRSKRSKVWLCFSKKRREYSKMQHMQQVHFIQGRKHIKYDEAFSSTLYSFKGTKKRLSRCLPAVTTQQIYLKLATAASLI